MQGIPLFIVLSTWWLEITEIFTQFFKLNSFPIILKRKRRIKKNFKDNLFVNAWIFLHNFFHACTSYISEVYTWEKNGLLFYCLPYLNIALINFYQKIKLKCEKVVNCQVAVPIKFKLSASQTSINIAWWAKYCKNIFFSPYFKIEGSTL